MAQLADLLALARGTPTETEPEPVGFVPPDFRALDSLLAKGSTSSRPPRRERPGSAPSAPPGSAQALAQQLAERRYGWTGPEWQALETLWNRESGFNPSAVNPSSGAAGIPQALPSAHPGLVTPQWMSDPRAQILWGLRYIAGRYGSPISALSASDRQHWY